MADITRDYYNRRYKDSTTALNEHQAARMEAILRYVAESENGKPLRLLDIGCGTGWLAEQLVRFGQVWGLDISEEAVRHARTRVPSGVFAAADFIVEPPAWEAFDVVVCSEVLEHFVDQARAISSLATLSKPGGRLILTTPNADVKSPQDFEAERLQPVENWLKLAELRKLLAPTFDIRRVTTTYVQFGEGGLYRLINSSKLSRVLRVAHLERAWRRAWERAGLGLYRVVLAIRRG